MATLKPAAQHIVELSDDEGCNLVAGTGGQQLDNKKYSARYLQRHGEEIHQALDVRVNPTIYSEERQQLEILVTPSDGSQAVVEAALKWFRKENNDVAFDVLHCSWDDLFDQMALAQSDLKGRVDGKGNWFKCLWRKAGSKKEAIEPWLELIPDEYGLSLVRGAIAIVFHIAQKHHEKKKALLEGFEVITDTIHNAMSKGVSFHREKEMRDCCQALYTCLSESLAELIWASKSEGKFKIPFKKNRNGQEKHTNMNIEDMLRKVKKKSIELDQCAQRIMAKKAIESHQGIGHLLLMTEQIGVSLSQFGNAAEFAVRTLAEKNDLVEQRLEYMSKDREQSASAALAQNLTTETLSELLEEFEQRLTRSLQRSLTPVPNRQEDLMLTPEDLLDLLDVPMDLANSDLRTAFTFGSNFSRQAHEQALSLFGESRFRHWVASPRAELLLVDGNDHTAWRGMVSPMSSLCAQMTAAMESLHGRNNVIVLNFWCSMHVDASSEARGPIGMVRSLLVQLVTVLLTLESHARLNFGPVTGVTAFMDDLGRGDINALRYAFMQLLNKVPRDMPVFVIIDNVTVFEDERFRDDLLDVVNVLDDLVSINQRVLKVLLTCPFRNTYLLEHGFVPREEHVLLEIGGRGGLGRITEESVLSYVSRGYPR